MILKKNFLQALVGRKKLHAAQRTRILSERLEQAKKVKKLNYKKVGGHAAKDQNQI